MRKVGFLIILITCFIGLSTAAQPKILEVTDNFGNSYDVSGAENGVTSVSVEEELVVSDDTEVTLCVSEVSAEDKDSLVYDFEALQTDGNNDAEATTDNCNTWNLEESDYTSQIGFRIRLGNQDDVEYSFYNRDYVVDYKFTNPVLPGEAEESDKFTYETVEISQSEYDKLKNQQNKDSEPDVPEGQRLVDENEWEELQERPTSDKVEQLEEEKQQKNEEISSLEETIAELRNQVSELESAVERLNKTKNAEKSETGVKKQNSSKQIQGNNSDNQENTQDKRNSEENRPGFVNNLLGSILG
jgi:hypothetical protein